MRDGFTNAHNAHGGPMKIRRLMLGALLCVGTSIGLVHAVSETYYVRTTGSDSSCDGKTDVALAGSSGGHCAFATPKKCANQIDGFFSGHDCIIHTGTYKAQCPIQQYDCDGLHSPYACCTDVHTWDNSDGSCTFYSTGAVQIHTGGGPDASHLTEFKGYTGEQPTLCVDNDTDGNCDINPECASLMLSSGSEAHESTDITNVRVSNLKIQGYMRVGSSGFTDITWTDNVRVDHMDFNGGGVCDGNFGELRIDQSTNTTVDHSLFHNIDGGTGGQFNADCHGLHDPYSFCIDEGVGTGPGCQTYPFRNYMKTYGAQSFIVDHNTFRHDSGTEPVREWHDAKACPVFQSYVGNLIQDGSLRWNGVNDDHCATATRTYYLEMMGNIFESDNYFDFRNAIVAGDENDFQGNIPGYDGNEGNIYIDHNTFNYGVFNESPSDNATGQFDAGCNDADDPWDCCTGPGEGDCLNDDPTPYPNSFISTNNIFVNAGTYVDYPGIDRFVQFRWDWATASANMTFDWNYYNTGDFRMDLGGETTEFESLSAWGEAMGYGFEAHSDMTEGNACEFVDVEGGDFHLVPETLCTYGDQSSNEVGAYGYQYGWCVGYDCPE